MSVRAAGCPSRESLLSGHTSSFRERLYDERSTGRAQAVVTAVCPNASRPKAALPFDDVPRRLVVACERLEPLAEIVRDALPFGAVVVVHDDLPGLAACWRIEVDACEIARAV
jgi:hypothetical protein